MQSVRVVVMGIAGSGKTTLGRALADRLGCAFIEGDDLHSEANVAKMAAGIPLDDDDRAPWLDAINASLRQHAVDRTSVVVACSALKRAYRERLRDGVVGLVFVVLAVDGDEAARRLRALGGHYMRDVMVASQLETLEMPAPDEAVVLDATSAVDDLVEQVVARLVDR